MSSRPHVLSIAGFDPSAGAGLLADIKTFEQHKVQGLGVCSSNTIQTEDTFFKVDWIDSQAILAQLAPLLEQYDIRAVKIGLIQNLEILLEILDFMEERIPHVIWDPIISASAGFDFHTKPDPELISEISQLVTVITPNIKEMSFLRNTGPEALVAEHPHLAVLLKGGHAEDHNNDLLYTSNGKTIIQGNASIQGAKHGTGCILSSAITANLALGKELALACKKAKTYVEARIASNPGLLAYHHE